jgi:hypothetical protein
MHASEELKNSVELEHKEVSQFIAAYHSGDVSLQQPFGCPILNAVIAKGTTRLPGF